MNRGSELPAIHLSPFTAHDLHVRIFDSDLQFKVIAIFHICFVSSHALRWPAELGAVLRSGFDPLDQLMNIRPHIRSGSWSILTLHAWLHFMLIKIRKKATWTIIYMQIMSVRWSYIHIYIHFFWGRLYEFCVLLLQLDPTKLKGNSSNHCAPTKEGSSVIPKRELVVLPLFEQRPKLARAG